MRLRSLWPWLLLLGACAGPARDFTLTLNPSSLSLLQGEGADLALALIPQGGFAGTVTLSLEGAPEGVSLSPTSLTVSGPTPQTLRLTTSPARTRAGSYSLRLVATAGSLRQEAPLALTVNPGFVVDTYRDSQDQNPGDGLCADGDGSCSLRAALAEAAGAPATVFTVVLPAGTYPLSLGALRLGGQVVLRGAGAGSTAVDAGGRSLVLQVLSGAQGRLEGLTLRGGFYGGLNSDAAGLRNEGSLTLRGVVVRDNGGQYSLGIFNTGSLDLIDSWVTGNNAGVGNTGTLTLTNATVSGNGGNGVSNLLGTATLTLTNATVSGNGDIGVYNLGTLRLLFSTVTGNSLGLVIEFNGRAEVRGNLLAGNTNGDCGLGLSSTVTSQGYNLVKDPRGCGFNAAGDRTGQDPLLGPLQDNGGPVPTHLPASNSPAVDWVPPSACTDASGSTPLGVDARGVSRPQPSGGNCDIGAVERRSSDL